MPSPVVLVVDDDPDIRQSLIQALESDGMTVIDAASGQEALRILDHDPTIGILLTDIMLPGITGITLAERVAQLRPDVKIVLTTAYAVADVLSEIRMMLRKPFRLDELRACIRALCNDGGDG